MSTISAAILLFAVIDPVGNVPFFISVLGSVEPRRQRMVVFREMLIALSVLCAFMFSGRYILSLLGISEPSLGMAGGIILFLIAVRMIFKDTKDMFGPVPEGEPLLVPLAIPMIAGPSAIATVLLLMAREPSRWPSWLAALGGAWLISCVILLCSPTVSALLGKRGITAVQRLMGMLLTTLAVEMFVSGIIRLLSLLP